MCALTATQISPLPDCTPGQPAPSMATKRKLSSDCLLGRTGFHLGAPGAALSGNRHSKSRDKPCQLVVVSGTSRIQTQFLNGPQRSVNRKASDSQVGIR